MELREWKYMNQPATNSAVSSGNKSFKKRFDKLIQYYGQHLPKEVDYIMVNLLTKDALDFTENFNDGDNARFNISINPATEAWTLKYYVNGGLVDSLSDTGWPELLKTLYVGYIDELPAKGTPEYNSLLTEALTEDVKSVPEKLYHATYLPFLDSIKANGLGKTENKMWSDSKSGVVYLADDPWVAESYAEISEWLDEVEDPDDYLNNIIILEVDTSMLDSSKFKVDSNVLVDEGEENSTWEYHEIIPWEACKIFDSTISEDFKAYENLWD